MVDRRPQSRLHETTVWQGAQIYVFFTRTHSRYSRAQTLVNCLKEKKNYIIQVKKQQLLYMCVKLTPSTSRVFLRLPPKANNIYNCYETGRSPRRWQQRKLWWKRAKSRAQAEDWEPKWTLMRLRETIAFLHGTSIINHSALTVVSTFLQFQPVNVRPCVYIPRRHEGTFNKLNPNHATLTQRERYE